MESLIMDNKKLDLNRPLLSVRRPISTQASEAESKTRSYDPASSKVPPSLPVYKSDIKSGPVRNPGTVPFQWEHKPGKPKDENRSGLQAPKQSHLVPKLPPGRILNAREQESVKKPDTKVNHQTKTGSNVSCSDKDVRKFEFAIVEDAKSFSRRYDDDDEDDNDAYMDATDTLSRSESFFLNCSVSGVSELDGNEGLHPFGTFSSDRQAQDLMMGSFLPAAKALTTETPSHSSRKPPKPEEQSRYVKKVVVKERRKKVQQNPYRFHHSPDEDEDRNTSMASGVCGLVPQICLKSSLGILNPVPSVRMQAQRAVSVRRLRSKYQGSTPRHENENKQTNGAVSEDKMKLKPRGEESACVTQKPNESGARINATPRSKVSRNFGELLASDDDTWKPSSEIPVAEKTLYVDTVHSLHTKEQEESKGESLKVQCPSLDTPVKDVQNLLGSCTEAKSTEQVNVNRNDGSPAKDLTEISSLKVAESQQTNSEHEVANKHCIEESLQDCNQAIIPLPKEKIDLEVQQQRITTTTLGNSIVHHRSHHLVTPPPLPKAPSDSWLKRTLPTIPSKNSFTWSSSSLGVDNTHFTKIQALHISQANPKWETMVKTSNTQQGFVHFSKETLNSIPEA